MPSRIAIRIRLLVLTAALLSAAVMWGPTAAAQAQSFPPVGKFCLPGQAGGRCLLPRSIDVDPSNGHYFAVDEVGRRVQEFTAWGEFVKAWGWGVVASGPGNKPQNEIQQLSVDATGGTFDLRFGSPAGFTVSQTAPIPFDASADEVRTALEDAPTFVGQDRFEPGDLVVTGPAGGPWVIEFVGQYEDSDFGGTNRVLYADSTALTGGTATATVAGAQDGGNFEICVPGNGDVCKGGSGGSAPGQFGAVAETEGEGPQGIAVDASGNVYVVDSENHRIQKFGPDGKFLLMFGGDVNVADGSDVCTAGDIEGGDVCGAGSFGNPGPGEGQFSAWGYRGDFIDVGPTGTVFVGDNERVQEFNPDGTFAGQITGGVLSGERVQSLSVGADGDLYVTFLSNLNPAVSKDDVRRLNQAGALVDTLAAGNPRGSAAGPAGSLFVISGANVNSPVAEIIEFDSSGEQVDLDPDSSKLGLGGGELDWPTGLAVNAPPTCGLASPAVAVANSGYSLSETGESFISVFGSAADPDVCPPPTQAPTIAAQFATSVDSGGATLKARINPHFWADTRYYVEYGTGKCSEGGCDREQPAAPGSLLTKDVVDAERTSAGVFLTDLAPATTYHYRFVAQSGGGGPVSGEERTFRTAPSSAGAAACPNDAFRTGPSAKLPDCRAYELVSPLEKANGDVSAPLSAFDQAAESGQRMTFGSDRAFSDPQAAPLISQYLASRGPAGWSTESISPPRGIPPLVGAPEGALGLYRAFSPDLCHGWVIGDTELTLSPDAPREVPNLYRRDNCGDGSYEPISPSLVPSIGPIPGSTYYFPTIQGYSQDLTRSVFRANAALMVAEGGPRPPFVCSATKGSGWNFPGPFQWLRDGAPIPGATERTYTSTSADEGHSIQCQVTRSDAAGASLTTSEVSLVEPIAGSPPDPGTRIAAGSAPLPGRPTISGAPKAGETLTCTPGTWKGSPTFAYQWYRNATEIAGETASTYVPLVSDRGKSIQCRTIGSSADGAAVADSASLVIEATLPFNETDPSVSGTPAVGQTLSCDPGTWSGNPTFAYQWLRNGGAIATATASTYTLAAADEGKAIQCRVAAANPDATVAEPSARVVVSPPPGTIPPELTTAPSVGGEAEAGEEEVGDVLVCDPGTWSGSPTFVYRWLRNGANIIGATDSEYILAAADLGKAIQCQVSATNAGGIVLAVDGSADGTRYPASEPPAPPFVSTQGNFQLYVSDEQGTQRLVSVLPDGSTSINSATAGTAWFGGLVISSREDQVRHAVSADASRVFWTLKNTFAGPEDPGTGEGALYLRLNAAEPQSAVSGGQCTEATKACTIAVSESTLTRFIAADPQGDRVIYAVGQGGSTATLDLYEAEIEEQAGQTVAHSSLIASGSRGVMGASEDARRVYLVSTQVLSGSEENSEGDTAQAGGQNLYLYEQGEGFDFVGALDPKDVFGGVMSVGDGSVLPPSPVATRPYQRLSRISPDGLRAAFTSTAPLTGYDNAHAVNGEPQGEVFVYDAAANSGEGELDCASCSPSGARPLGRLVSNPSSSPDDDIWVAATLPGWNSHFQPSRALSEDGNRVFFDAYDSLVPGDSNGKADVYQWEASGSGSCTAADPSFSLENGGCVSLISSGEGAEDSSFLDASASGSDVFFTTQSSLLPQDYGLRDVYDARVNGGFPVPAPTPQGCEGEACQGPQTPPNDPTPASQSFQGAGNAKSEKPSRRCPKGKTKVKKRGKTRCVNKRGKAGKTERRANQNRRASR